MKKYKDFKEFIEDNYLEEIKNELGPYISAHKDAFEKNRSERIISVDEDNIEYTVVGVSFKDLDDDWIEIRTSVNAEVNFELKIKGDRDWDSDEKTYSVIFKARLCNGLQDVELTKVSEYCEGSFNKNSLSQNLLFYMPEENMDDFATKFLRKYYPEALEKPVSVDVNQILKEMELTMYLAPLGDKIFGKTYFREEKVEVYEDYPDETLKEINASAGTILVNPNVYFFRGCGVVNNTIIHECVHWEFHRKAFELQRLLHGVDAISCKTAGEEYEGISIEASVYKWMEWQANHLAPRILMPKESTKRIFEEKLTEILKNNPGQRRGVSLEQAVFEVADFFSVSRLSAKIRLLELGYREVEGTCLYSYGRKALPPYAFNKDAIAENQTFIIDEVNLIILLCSDDKSVSQIKELYHDYKIIYVNHMLCLNDSRYVSFENEIKPVLTDYALDHVDECCFAFNVEYSKTDEFKDTYYKKCFLGREIDSGYFSKCSFDPEHKVNQSKEKMEAENHVIADCFKSYAEIKTRCIKEVLTSYDYKFVIALNFYMDKYDEEKISLGELAKRTGISKTGLSGYHSGSKKPEKDTLLAIIKGLYLDYLNAYYLLDCADVKIDLNRPGDFYVDYLIRNHMDDTWEQWVEKLINFGMAKEWIPEDNSTVKSVRKGIEDEKKEEKKKRSMENSR